MADPVKFLDKKTKCGCPQCDYDDGNDEEDDESEDNEEDEPEDGSEHDINSGHPKKPNKETWTFDNKMLTRPNLHNGRDLAYFQPWFAVVKAEVTSCWPGWAKVLAVFEEVGGPRVDMMRLVKVVGISYKAAPQKRMKAVAN